MIMHMFAGRIFMQSSSALQVGRILVDFSNSAASLANGHPHERVTMYDFHDSTDTLKF